MVIIAAALSLLLAQVVRSNVLDEAAQEARDTLSGRAIAKLSPEDLSQGMRGERYTEFDRFISESVVSARTARIKVWNREGMVVYSTDPAQIGQRFPIKPDLQEALAGGIGRDISVPQAAENEREKLLGTLLEVYVPIRFPDSVEPAGALEIYQYYAPFADFIERQQMLIFAVISGGFLLLYLSLVLLVARGWLTITRQRRRLEQSARELGGLNRLLQSHLKQRQQVIEELQQLYNETAGNLPNSQEWQQHYIRLRRLADEAAAFPTPPTA